MATENPRDYVRSLNEYARGVVDGKIVSGKLARLSCERHLKDLSKQGDEFPYYFDEDAAVRVCAFAELLPHVKGEWARKHQFLELEPWECFILGVSFGWKRKSDGLRRFREIYAAIPRKNGKSLIGAVIGNYMFIADGEHGAEVYSGATTEKQAYEVYGPARLMLVKSPDICADAGIEINAKTMVRLDDRSKFEALIGNPGDGASPSCAIIDEFHEHQTSNQYDTMVTGTGARSQPMIAIITTAGSSLAGPCYDKHLQAIKVLEGAVENEQLFTIIYTCDETDDWADPAILPKANPNYGISVSADFLITQQRQAVLNAEYQNRFKTKHLNIWCSAKTAWMNMQLWQLCGDPGLTIDEFKGEHCWFILDLASRNDICAFMQLFKKRLNGEWHYYAFGKYYLPESTVNEPGPNTSSYQKWVNQGHLIAVDGNEIDYDQIKADVIDLGKSFQVDEVVYDPWRAVHLAQQLMKDGAVCVEFRNTVQTMSLPMKELMSAVKSGRFHHNNDPVMTWAMSNVVAKEDAKENIYPRKEKNDMKIDPIVAIIMGLGRAIVDNGNGDINDWLQAKPVLV